MNFDALLGDVLMVVASGRSLSCCARCTRGVMCVVFNVWLWWRVLQARVLLHFRLWLLAAERHRMYMCFVAVSVSVTALMCALMLYLCAVMTAQC